MSFSEKDNLREDVKMQDLTCDDLDEIYMSIHIDIIIDFVNSLLICFLMSHFLMCQ